MKDTRKEYLKTFIIKIIEGKVDKGEVQKVKQNLMNYSREEWRDLKIVGKELAKEAIDEKISELPADKLSSE